MSRFDEGTPIRIGIDALTLSPTARASNNLILSLDSIPESPAALRSAPSSQSINRGNFEDYDPEEEQRRNSDQQNPDIVYSGFVYKRTDSGGNWKKRWMVLYKGGPIYYYDSIGDEEPSGALYLVNASLFEKIQFNGFTDARSFGVRVDGKDFLLKAKNEAEKVTWCNSIDQNISTVVLTKKKGESSQKKRTPVSGSFYSSGASDSPELPPPKAESSSSDSSSSEDDSDEEEEEEEEIEDESIAIEGGAQILKNMSQNIWTTRHVILEKSGSLFIYREQSDYPCDLIQVNDATLLSRVQQKGAELSDCFTLQYNKKNYTIKVSGTEEKKKWVDAIRKLQPRRQELNRRMSTLVDLDVLKENRKATFDDDL